MPSIRPRKQPRQERARATVDAILDATAHILTEEGYGGLSTNKIARRAGVSVGSLYQYFPNKEAILVAIMERFSEQQLALFSEGLAELPGSTLEEGVRKLLETCITAELLQQDLQRVFLREVPDLGQHELLRQGIDLITALVSVQLQARADRLRPIDNPQVAAYVLTCACHGVLHDAVQRSGEEGRPDPEVLVTTLQQMVLRFLGLDPWPAEHEG